MTKEPLSKSVSVSELLYLRNVEHLTNKQIGQKLDVHPATVMRYIGPDIRQPDNPHEVSRGRKITTKVVMEIRELYAQGGSINNIAERVGVSWKTVKKYVSDLGPNHKKLMDPPPDTAEQTVEPEVPVDNMPETKQEPEPPDAEPVPEPTPTEPEEPVKPAAVQEGEKPMLQIISSRQTIRMKGAECQYLLEFGCGTDTVTILTEDNNELAVLDAEGLSGFIGELSQILCKMKDTAAA